MIKKLKFLTVLFLVGFQFTNLLASNFNQELKDIRAEINRDNLQDAIKLIKKITISNETEQEKINVLFGDIYLKINQPQKAEEFYQKSFFTSNQEIETLTLIGLAEVRLTQGRLNDAIDYAEKSININSDKIRPKLFSHCQN